MFGAFKHYNFRVYFVGLFISITGVWAQNVAQSWLVYELTNSALVLGQASFTLAIPILVLSPWAGVIIDRTSRRTNLLITQSLLLLQAFALAFLDFGDLIAIWQIILLSLVQGVGIAFDAPSRQSIIVELVGKEDLSNGIALNSTLFGLARTFGPAIGGLIVATLGTAWGFTVNGVTYFAILVSLLLLRLDKPVVQPAEHTPLEDLLGGLRFIWRTRTIRAMMTIALAVALSMAASMVLMPVVAVEVLGKDEIEYGLLSSAAGLGSIVGALLVTYFSSRPGRGRKLVLMNILYPLALMGFALSRSYYLSLVVLVGVGVMMIPQLAMCNMLIQSYVPNEFRGRVMSVYTLLFFGMHPFGGLIFGGLAERFTAPVSIAIGAGFVLMMVLAIQVLVPELNKLE
jgi:MFS family permease